MNLADVRMIYRSRNSGFAPESFAQLRIKRTLMDDFDRDRPKQTLINRSVNRAHAAFTQFRFDTIVGKRLTDHTRRASRTDARCDPIMKSISRRAAYESTALTGARCLQA